MEDTDQVVLTFESEGTSDIHWTVTSGTLTEALDQGYSASLHLDTDDMAAEPIGMLGQPCRLVIQRGMAVRQITGIVTRVVEGSSHPELLSAKVVVSPALEALRHRVNTRIFQEMTVPEILEEVLEAGLGGFDRTLELRLTRQYPTCEYRTQYNEPDLTFCQRLMEEEGIVSWFELSDDEPEKLILSDDAKHFGEVESLQTDLPSSTLLFSLYEGAVGGHEYVSSFEVESQLRPTVIATRHYNWTRSSSLLEGDSKPFDPPARDQPNGALLPPEREVYQHDDQPLCLHEYDGRSYPASDMSEQLRLRREAQAYDARVAEGRSTVLGVTAGQTFDLANHPQGDLNASYLVLSATHAFDATGNHYENRFRCISKDVPYRPKRTTPKPRIPNMQTATVVGPAGEEIHTDEHGRIKVQFHWDRLGASDEHSSLWIRVMQPWAGAGWGFVFLPRIGMEVVVNFVNGDPDLPVVAGSLYNDQHPPPYPLPDEKTKSTIKTESSLGGGGFNELRFEDKKSEEEIFIHAEKDFNEVVEHDHFTLVHHDQTNEVDNDHTELVHHRQRLTVDDTRDKHVKSDETTKVDGNRTEDVGKDETITIKGFRMEEVGKDENVTVKADRKLEIKGNDLRLISRTSVERIGTVGEIEAGEMLTLKCGSAELVLNSDGTIDLKGTTIKIDGSDLVEVVSALITLN